MYIVLLVFVAAVIIVLNLPVFGRLPSGKEKSILQENPHFREGALQNISFTPVKPADVSYGKMMYEFFFGNHPGKTPQYALPSVYPDFAVKSKPVVTWFGHSTYLLQCNRVNILVDPVFSKRASPFQFAGSAAFKGMDFIELEAFPAIDLVLITHDHYDHLDYHVILKLKKSNTRFVCALGVGAHLVHWGITPGNIYELAWGEELSPIPGINFLATTARHFSGRKFKRNQSFWSAYILTIPGYKFYLGGDSGYDRHFAEIGEAHGPFDLAVLECGQYNTMWPNIHMFPEETVQAAADLQAKILLPVHWGKFALAMHPWNEPIERLVKSASEKGISITTPLPGESIIINEYYPVNAWWKENYRHKDADVSNA